MKYRLSCAVLALASITAIATPGWAQTFSVTQPAGTVNLKAAEDYATRAFQDPWDMSQRTDLGWWLYGTDQPPSNFANPTFSNGVFSATMSGGTGRLFLLESPLFPEAGTSTAVAVGKTGQLYPIDASKYTHLVYRMSSTVPGVSQYIWSTNTIYQDQTIGVEQTQSATAVQLGWKIYDVTLPNLTPVNSGLGTPQTWAGTIRALQMLPNAASSTATIQFDWIRLVQEDATPHQNIAWTGGTADIYLDNDNDPTNGTLGRIAVNATSPYNFFAGALPSGRYFVAVHAPTSIEVPGGSGGFTYSPGSYVINDIPTLQFTTPSEEGSSDDFATTQLGQPWDFTYIPNSIDTTLRGFSGRPNVVGDSVTQIPLTNEAGTPLGNQTVYVGSSCPPPWTPTCQTGDPQVYPLFWDGKGKATKIDPQRYRILTIDAGLPNLARSLPNGSIMRVIWRAVNEPISDPNTGKQLAVSEQFVINSASGENTLAHVSLDLSKVPLAEGDTNTTWTSPSATSAGLDAFRFDPHEFTPQTNFFIKRIKLAALEHAQAGQFTFKWNASKSGTVTVYYDTDLNDTNFSLTTSSIACGPVIVSAGPGSCTWTNANAVGQNEVKVWAKIIDSSSNVNEVYARTNLDTNPAHGGAQIVLNRTSLNYTTYGPTRTSSQVVRLTFVGAGGQCWTATPNALGLLSISPSSGTGAAAVSIAATGNFPGGLTTLYVKFQNCSDASDTATVAVNVTGVTSVSGPGGSFDTPTDGATVTGSVAVTGWAIDDVEVTAVAICRDPVAGESAPPSGPCGGQAKIFIGNAVFIDDARPDVLSANPTAPLNYRTGWGYLLLSNFLPSQGNGTVVLYAYASDRDGHTSLLGTKTINAQNASALKPFGAIDTPDQGAVVCGVVNNFGWVLSHGTAKADPPDGGTVTVFVDGSPVGTPGGWTSRQDLSALFPVSQYSGVGSALGVFGLDTTRFTNGIHSIFWLVTDSGGQQDGIGSRFFTISNPCTP